MRFHVLFLRFAAPFSVVVKITENGRFAARKRPGRIAGKPDDGPETMNDSTPGS
jgi:hypothetical protein